MLNRPSWEERRKGGEGRSRPRQAKNAIIVVVGAGRPLCLDGKGSGDTQDEPHDHWHILTDRLVACARHGGLGDHRPSPPHPPLGFRGTRARPMGASPSLRPMLHSTLLLGHAETHFLGPVGPSPGLTPGVFFLSAPPRPLPVQQGRNPAPVSTVSTTPPPPTSTRTLVVDIFWSLKQRPGGLYPTIETPWPTASRRTWLTSCILLTQRCTSFLPLGNLIERERETTEIWHSKDWNPPILLKHISWWRKPVFFLRPYQTRKQNHKMLGAKVVQVRVNHGWGPEMLQTAPIALRNTFWGERQDQLKTAVGALEVSATDFWWWLEGLHRDLGFLHASLCFSKSWGWMNGFERGNCTLKPLKQVAETQLQTFAWLGTYKLVIFIFNVRVICKRVKITQILKRKEAK